MKSILFASAIFVAKSQDLPVDPSFLTGFIDAEAGVGGAESFTCSNTTDCAGLGSGFTCNTAAPVGVCVFGCSTDSDCAALGEGSGLGKCENGGCVVNEDCTDDNDCASLVGFTCGSDSKCKDPVQCTSNADCTLDGVGYCDSTLGLCQPERCTDTNDCITSGYVCVADTGYCIEGCQTSNVCQSPLICSSTSGLCEVQCTEDSQCTGFTNTCDPDLNVCILTCSEDKDCTDIGLPSSQCIQPDSATGATFGSCAPTQGFVAGGTSCTTDADCSGKETCEPTLKVCYNLCETDADCDTDQQCLDSATAKSLPAIGDQLNDIPDGIKTCVDISGNDVSCSSDGDCPSGYKCNSFLVAGACYPACDDQADCTALGFKAGTACATEKYDLPLGSSVSIKFCDPNQTPSPTMADDSKAGRNGIVAVIVCVFAMIAFV